MIYINSTLSFIMNLFSYAIYAYKYATGASNMAPFRFSIASITSVVTGAFVDTVGNYGFFINCVLIFSGII